MPGYNQDATGHKRNNEVVVDEASAARGGKTVVGEGGASYSSRGEARQRRMRRVNNKKGFTSIVKGKDDCNDEGCDFNKN